VQGGEGRSVLPTHADVQIPRGLPLGQGGGRVGHTVPQVLKEKRICCGYVGHGGFARFFAEQGPIFVKWLF
jgi:hypothetical protein